MKRKTKDARRNDVIDILNKKKGEEYTLGYWLEYINLSLSNQLHYKNQRELSFEFRILNAKGYEYEKIKSSIKGTEGETYSRVFYLWKGKDEDRY